MTKEMVVLLFSLASFGVVIVIGIYFTRRQRSLGAYFQAERNVGTFVSGVAIASTYYSAWGFLGAGGLNYAGGYAGKLTTLLTGLVPMYLISFFLNAKKMRMVAESHGALTIPDAIYARYRSEACRLLGAISVLVTMILYFTPQLSGIGLLIKEIFGISYEWGVIVGLGIMASYTVLGGIQAAIYSDVFQGVLMCLIAVWFTLAGSFMTGGQAPSYEAMKAINPLLVDPWKGFALGFVFSYAIGMYAGFILLPHTTTRYMMVRNFNVFRWLPWLNGIIATFIMGLLSSFWGPAYSYRVLEYTGVAPRLTRADDVHPVFMMRYQPATISGMGYAGVFAAILSTGSGMINVSAAAIVKDIMMGSLKMKLRNEVLTARIATFCFAALCAFLALFFSGLIAVLSGGATAVAGTTIALAWSIGINWRGASKEAAIVCMILGIILAGGGLLAVTYKWITLPLGITAAGFAVAITWPLFFIISKLTRGANRENVPADIGGIVDMPLFSPRALPIRRVG